MKPSPARRDSTANDDLRSGLAGAPGNRLQNLIWAETGERLTEESFARYRQSSTTKRVIYVALTENTVKTAISSPLTMIISDGNRCHPREAGTYSRMLGKSVREEQALTLMQALRKMTINPSRRLKQGAPIMLIAVRPLFFD